MEDCHYDILILGAGCAGLSAGIYAGRAGRRALILENGIPGGQAALTHRVENFPGVVQTSGAELMEVMTIQAQQFGCCLKQTSVTALELYGQTKWVQTGEGKFTADAVILATGAVPRELGIPGEQRFRGKGVSYCATCDGFFYRDRDIFVVGGGNSAAQEALHLAEFGRQVFLVVRRDSLGCETAIARQIQHHPKIRVLYETQVTEIFGKEMPRGLHLKNSRTGEITTYTVDKDYFGIFIFIGYRPNSDLFRGLPFVDENGYVRTASQMQTLIPGVYAAGDVRRKSLRQIVTACADGAIAAHAAAKNHS